MFYKMEAFTSWSSRGRVELLLGLPLKAASTAPTARSLLVCVCASCQVAQMVQREPEKRLTAEEYLKQQRGKAFPDIFYTFLQPYMAQFAKETFQSADERVLIIRKDLDNILHNLHGGDASLRGKLGEGESLLLLKPDCWCLFPLRLRLLFTPGWQRWCDELR